MKMLVLASFFLASASAAMAANPDKDAVKALIKAVKLGTDLTVTFHGAVSPRENTSLQRVAKCSATNLMKQRNGFYTVVWDCGSKGALAMRVMLTDGKIVTVSTESLSRQPNMGSR